MFLPDSLMREFEMAELSGQLVCGRPIEILPNRTQFEIDYLFAPLTVFCVWLIVHAALSYRRRNVKKNLMLHEAILLGVTGLISLLVLFLWFLTDHTTTQYNWNVLWASPLHFLLLVFYQRRGFVRKIALVQLSLCLFLLVAFPWLPQSLHVASIPIALMLIITYFRLYRNARIIEHYKSTKNKE
jgi:hypothetical protein